MDDLDDDDLSLVLNDAIVHSNLDTIRTLLGLRPSLTIVLLDKFYKRGAQPRYESPHFDYSLCLAVWKSSTQVLRFLVDHPSQLHQDKRLMCALATAIETKNRDNIKYLLSFSPDLTQNISLPRNFEQRILNTERVQGPRNYRYHLAEDIVSRSLSLWDPEFMDFLIYECHILIPRNLNAPGGLFSQPAIHGLTLDQVRDRFEQMRKYLDTTDSRTFDDGICRAIASFSPHGLAICLENHGNPDSSSINSKNALGLAYKRNNRTSKEMMRLLLNYGAAPTPKNAGGYAKTVVMNSFRRNEGISWDNFVQKARSGEALDIIFPEKKRDKA